MKIWYWFAIAIAFIVAQGMAVGKDPMLPAPTPEALRDERMIVREKIIHSSPEECEKELDQLALHSELCRMNYHAKECGLPPKPLRRGLWRTITDGKATPSQMYYYYVVLPRAMEVNQFKIDPKTWRTDPHSKSNRSVVASAQRDSLGFLFRQKVMVRTSPRPAASRRP